MHFQYFIKGSIYDVWTRFSQFSVFLKFYQYLWSEFSKNTNKFVYLEALCFVGQLSRNVRVWHLSLSQYKLTAFVTCSITELNIESHYLFTLFTGQLTCKAQYCVL